jgi:methylase of polypeptide subunit release factors
MTTLTKDWNRHVTHAEEIARGPGFRDLRDRIIELAAPQPEEVAVDVGSGTGLLSLALAAHVDQVWAIDISPSPRP